MRRKLTIIAMVIMLLLIGSGGWDEFDIEGCEKVNYITVVVQAQVCVRVLRIEGAETSSLGVTTEHRAPWSGAELHIEINKAGGERVTFDEITNTGGCTEFLYGTFRVCREQYVEVKATPISGTLPHVFQGDEWTPQSVNKYKLEGTWRRENWETISAGKDFGDTYYWNPVLDIVVQPKS